MSDAVIVALISGAFTLMGSLIGVLISNNLTTYRLNKLEEKVDKHNKVVERTFVLEGQVKEIQHDIVDIKKAIEK